MPKSVGYVYFKFLFKRSLDTSEFPSVSSDLCVTLLAAGLERSGVGELSDRVISPLQEPLHRLGILRVDQHDAVGQLREVIADSLCGVALAEGHHVVFDDENAPLTVTEESAIRQAHGQSGVLLIHLSNEFWTNTPIVYQFGGNDNGDVTHGMLFSMRNY